MEGEPGEPGVESGTEEQPPNQPQAREAPVEAEAVSGEVAEAAQSQGFTTGPMQFSLGGMPAEATATIHVQTEGGAGPPGGLAEAISAMMQQANSVMGGAGGPLEGNISIRVE